MIAMLRSRTSNTQTLRRNSPNLPQGTLSYSSEPKFHPPSQVHGSEVLVFSSNNSPPSSTLRSQASQTSPSQGRPIRVSLALSGSLQAIQLVGAESRLGTLHQRGFKPPMMVGDVGREPPRWCQIHRALHQSQSSSSHPFSEENGLVEVLCIHLLSHDSIRSAVHA